MRTSNLLTPAQRTICAAVGVSEKAYLRRRAFEDIGHRLTYHAVRPGDDEDGDDDAAGRDHRDNLHDDDDSPEGHVQRAKNALEAFANAENDAGRLERLRGARGSIDRAMECYSSGGRDAMMRFTQSQIQLPKSPPGKYASFTSNELTRAMLEIKRASH